jgi:hypothetical protein
MPRVLFQQISIFCCTFILTQNIRDDSQCPQCCATCILRILRDSDPTLSSITGHGSVLHRSTAQAMGLKHRWTDESFSFLLHSPHERLEVTVWDQREVGGTVWIAQCVCNLTALHHNPERVSETFHRLDLFSSTGSSNSTRIGTLGISLSLRDVRSEIADVLSLSLREVFMRMPVLKDNCPVLVMSALAKQVKAVPLPTSSHIIRAGSTGSSIFFIVHGCVGVFAGQVRVAGLGVGESFGEVGAFFGGKRSADVVTETSCVVLEISHAALWEVSSGQHPMPLTLLSESRIPILEPPSANFCIPDFTSCILHPKSLSLYDIL